MIVFQDAAYFIRVIGEIVNGLIEGNYLAQFLVVLFTVLCTIKMLGKLTYRENGN